MAAPNAASKENLELIIVKFKLEQAEAFAKLDQIELKKWDTNSISLITDFILLYGLNKQLQNYQKDANASFDLGSVDIFLHEYAEYIATHGSRLAQEHKLSEIGFKRFAEVCFNEFEQDKSMTKSAKQSPRDNSSRSSWFSFFSSQDIDKGIMEAIMNIIIDKAGALINKISSFSQQLSSVDDYEKTQQIEQNKGAMLQELEEATEAIRIKQEITEKLENSSQKIQEMKQDNKQVTEQLEKLSSSLEEFNEQSDETDTEATIDQLEDEELKGLFEQFDQSCQEIEEAAKKLDEAHKELDATRNSFKPGAGG